MPKSCPVAERYYKREKVRRISLRKKGYDQARASETTLILEIVSIAGETSTGRPEN